MMREELIDLAEQAGFEVIKKDNEFSNGRFNHTVWWYDRPLTLEMEKFAALVAAKERDKWMERVHALILGEREGCAKVCEDLDLSQDSTWQVATLDCAAAIRARGDA